MNRVQPLRWLALLSAARIRQRLSGYQIAWARQVISNRCDRVDSELQRLLAERGMVISAGKMSGLWSGQPNTVKLDELDVICAVLGCEVGELLLPGPVAVPEPATSESRGAVAEAPAVTPRSRTGQSLPPR
jgi:DNA-binding Xre family transcriptional regulator